MPKASDLNLSGPTSFLFKSPWGFGKTLAAASFALEGPTYLAYWDKKKPVELVTFFKQFGQKGKRILENLEYDVYGSDNANQYLNKCIDMKSNCKYTAFITDSVTTMTSGAVNWSLGFDGKKKIVHGSNSNANPEQMMPSWDEYKTETSLVSQALDICRVLPCHIIWTAHPLPGTKIEGSGSSMKVSKVNTIVTYGSKVGGLVPGQFTEIYHFTKNSDFSTNPSTIRFKASTEAIGDDYAKTALGLPKELDFTNKLFYEVWKDALKAIDESDKLQEVNNEVNNNEGKAFNPFASDEKPKWKV